MRPTLATLPPEIIAAIAAEWTNLRTASFGLNRLERLSPPVLEARRALRHLSATCAQLRRITQPILFRVFDGCATLATLSLFLRAILRRDDLRHAVRTIQILALAPYYSYDKEPLISALRRFAKQQPDPAAWMRNFEYHPRTQPATIMALLLLTFPSLQALQTPWPADYEHVVKQWVLDASESEGTPCPNLTALSVHTPGDWLWFEFGQAGGLLQLRSLRRLVLCGVGFGRNAFFPPQTYHITELHIESCMLSAPIFRALCEACITLRSVKVNLAPGALLDAPAADDSAHEALQDIARVVLALQRHRQTLRCLHFNFEQFISTFGDEVTLAGAPVPGLVQLEALEELKISIPALIGRWGPQSDASLQGFLPLSIKRLVLVGPDPYCFDAVAWLADPGRVVYPKLEAVHVMLRQRLAKEEYLKLSLRFEQQRIRYTID